MLLVLARLDLPGEDGGVTPIGVLLLCCLLLVAAVVVDDTDLRVPDFLSTPVEVVGALFVLLLLDEVTLALSLLLDLMGPYVDVLLLLLKLFLVGTGDLGGTAVWLLRAVDGTPVDVLEAVMECLSG